MMQMLVVTVPNLSLCELQLTTINTEENMLWTTNCFCRKIFTFYFATTFLIEERKGSSQKILVPACTTLYKL